MQGGWALCSGPQEAEMGENLLPGWLGLWVDFSSFWLLFQVPLPWLAVRGACSW